MLSRLFIATLWSPGGKGWPLGSCLWCFCDFVTFPLGILGQMWQLIVSIHDPFCLPYFLLLNWSNDSKCVFPGSLILHFTISSRSCWEFYCLPWMLIVILSKYSTLSMLREILSSADNHCTQFASKVIMTKQNKAQWLAACGHVSLRFILSVFSYPTSTYLIWYMIFTWVIQNVIRSLYNLVFCVEKCQWTRKLKRKYNFC